MLLHSTVTSSPEGFVVTTLVGSALKFAVILCGALIVTEAGLVVPLALPDQDPRPQKNLPRRNAGVAEALSQRVVSERWLLLRTSI